jgi:hypothetical protein
MDHFNYILHDCLLGSQPVQPTVAAVQCKTVIKLRVS